MAKRKIFDELIEGVAAMKKHREGKLTLRSYKEDGTPGNDERVESAMKREQKRRSRKEQDPHAFTNRKHGPPESKPGPPARRPWLTRPIDIRERKGSSEELQGKRYASGQTLVH